MGPFFVRKRRIEQSHHPSCVRSKDCNIVNEATCLTTTPLVIRVVVGEWKSLVFNDPGTKTAIDSSRKDTEMIPRLGSG